MAENGQESQRVQAEDNFLFNNINAATLKSIAAFLVLSF
jgi:hypothetical protein